MGNREIYFLKHWDKAALLLADLLGFVALFLMSISIRHGSSSVMAVVPENFIFILSFLFLIFYVFDLYKFDSIIAGLRPPGRAVLATLVFGVVISLFIYAIGPQKYVGDLHGRGVWAMTLGFFAVYSSLARYLGGKLSSAHLNRQSWLAVGRQEDLDALAEEFKSEDEKGTLSSFVLGENPDYDNLRSVLKKNWSGVIIADDSLQDSTLVELIVEKRLNNGTRIFSISDFFEKKWFKVPVKDIQNRWFIFAPGFYLVHDKIGLRFKRIVDIILSSIGLILSAPVIFITSIIVKFSDGGPVLFKQIRTGKNGEPFTMYKFRSMRVDAEKDGAKWATANDSRITPVGNILRKSRIDEIPQLLNVLKGEMSFIGPRPERPEFNKMLMKEIPFYNLRHLVRPGVTGWAQVLYRYGASVKDAEEKLKYDLYYIKNFSLILEFAIILKTLRVVVLGKGR
jgi:exopolysaccharide biosynthesis polyprenyl glycosylphosphotransferase